MKSEGSPLYIKKYHWIMQYVLAHISFRWFCFRADLKKRREYLSLQAPAWGRNDGRTGINLLGGRNILGGEKATHNAEIVGKPVPPRMRRWRPHLLGPSGSTLFEHSGSTLYVKWILMP